MKRKFTFLALLLCFITTNVYAEPVTWPNTFTYGEYQYQIEGVSLRVYTLEKEEGEDEVTEESFNNFINEVMTKEIPLSSTNYTINPEYRTEKINGIDNILVNLNLNITKEQLESLLSEELSNITPDRRYIAELAVNYKLTQYPQNYQHIYSSGYLRALVNFFLNKLPEEQDMTKTIHQVFNAATISYNEETNEPELLYENTLTEENEIGNYVLNYLELFENAYSEDNQSPSKILMFYNIDNIDYLIENLNSIESDIEDDVNVDNPKTSITDEVIAIPNTAEKVPTYMYIISISCIIIGLLTMGYAIYRDRRIG